MIEFSVKHDKRTITIRNEFTDGTSLPELIDEYLVPLLVALGWEQDQVREYIWTISESEKIYSEGYNAGLRDARAEADHAKWMAEEDARIGEIERLEKESIGISYG